MTSQISFGTKEMGLAVKEDKGDFKLKAINVPCLPVNPLWTGIGFLGVSESGYLAYVSREDDEVIL